MGLLHEIEVRAKCEGEYTLEWAILQRFIPAELSREDLSGTSDFLKLKAWAERQGLLVDFDVELVSFMAEIRTVTFRNRATHHLLRPNR